VQGSLGPCPACRGIAEPASADCFLSGEVEEVAGEEIVGCAVIAETREVHSLGKHVEETVGLEKEATSDFEGHSHKRFPLGQCSQIQETIRPIHPFDLASWSLEGHLSWVIVRSDFVGEEVASKPAEPSCVVAFVETSLIAGYYFAMCEAIVKLEWMVSRRSFLLVVAKDLVEEHHEVVANDLEGTRCFDFVAD
jgi:hypothetical protein